MKLSKLFGVGIMLMTLCSGSHLIADDDIYEYSKGEIILLNPSSLHPTQFLYSKLEVDSKVKELKGIMDTGGPEGVKRFLDEKKGEVVVGPRNKMWLVDGHHQAKALESLLKSDPRFAGLYFVVEVRNEWNELTSQEFEAAMKAGNKKLKSDEPSYVYLRDQNGKIRSFKSLPRRLSSLKDYPWRSLVWMLKERDVIDFVERFPFQEFYLAEELRKKIPLPSKMTPKSYEKAFKRSVEVVGELDEDKLFGFEVMSDTDCARILKRVNQK
jgi:hypothetical protein